MAQFGQPPRTATTTGNKNRRILSKFWAKLGQTAIPSEGFHCNNIAVVVGGKIDTATIIIAPEENKISLVNC